MRIGTYYYPEQWPREQWARDFDNIAKMGLKIVHMGEFAWFDLEPAEGEFRFDWLAESVEMAAKRKLDVILCTPTAAPPIWLVEKHPEILPVDEHGTRARFGGRRHYSPTAPALHDATRRIVGALADRFAKHPRVIGWQIDNEYSSAFFDQNPHSHEAFRAWLRARYANDIKALNHAWGCQFWNTYYTDFGQVLLPPRREAGYANPHQVLDASRFWSAAFAQYNRLQAEILKSRLAGQTPEPFITTNYMAFGSALDVSPADMAGDMSMITWDAYPVGGFGKNESGQAYRMGDPSFIGFSHDVCAGYLNRWALMELQPGQVNWSATPNLLYPGAVRLWLWTALAHGAEFTTTYRFRQPRFGVEMWHHGLVGTDGVTPSQGGREFMQAIEEVSRLDAKALASAAPASAEAGGVAILFDFDQLWWFKILPQSRRWDQFQWLTRWYSALCRLGVPVQVLHVKQPIPAHVKHLIVPGMQMVDDADVASFKEFAQRGGHLLLTCRTALMDRTGQFFEGPIARPIIDLIGAEIPAYDGLPEGTFASVAMDVSSVVETASPRGLAARVARRAKAEPASEVRVTTTTYSWGVWGDLLSPAPGTRVLVHYEGDFHSHLPAVTQHAFGKGAVTYCGVYGEQEFIDALVQKVIPARPSPLPPRTQLLRRGAYWIFLNYNDSPAATPAPAGAKFVLGSKTTGAAGVSVWTEA